MRWILLTCLLLAGCTGSDLVLPGETNAASLEVVQGADQHGTVGASFDHAITVEVTDAEGHPAAQREVRFTPESGAAGSQFSPATARTGNDGRVSTRWTLGRSAGTQHARVELVGGDDGDLSASFAATARAGDPDTVLAVAGGAQSAGTGDALPDSLVVEVRDRFGNPVPGVTVEWDAEGGGELHPASSETDQDGRAATRRILGNHPGTQSATARVDGAAGSPVVFDHLALSGGGHQNTSLHLSLSTQPSGHAESGHALDRQPVVQLRDEDGTVERSGVAVTVALVGGGSLSGTTTRMTDGSGRARFTDLRVGGGDGTRHLIFSAPGAESVTSDGIDVSAASPPPSSSPARLAFAVQPSDVHEGRRISPAVRVAVLDDDGHVVTGSTLEITIQLRGGEHHMHLHGDTKKHADRGVAEFDDLTIKHGDGNVTLTASAAGLPTIESHQFHVEH